MFIVPLEGQSTLGFSSKTLTISFIYKKGDKTTIFKNPMQKSLNKLKTNYANTISVDIIKTFDIVGWYFKRKFFQKVGCYEQGLIKKVNFEQMTWFQCL